MSDSSTSFLDQFVGGPETIATPSPDVGRWDLDEQDDTVVVDAPVDDHCPWWWTPGRKREHRAAIAAIAEETLRIQRDRHALSQRWPTSRMCLVMNEKGGSGKTPTSIILAGALGNHTGTPPVLVDLNPTGNLRTRLEHGDGASDLDAMAASARNLLAPGTPVTRVKQYTIWQNSGRFDALIARNRPYTTTSTGRREFAEPTISQQEADDVFLALEQQYPILILDGSNSLALPPTVAALQHPVNALVVPVFWERDHARMAMDTLKKLEDTGRGLLASTAIIAHVNRTPPDMLDQSAIDQATWYENSFTRRGLTVIEIPFDPVINTPKDPITWEALHQQTRDAAIRLAAEVMRRFGSNA